MDLDIGLDLGLGTQARNNLFQKTNNPKCHNLPARHEQEGSGAVQQAPVSKSQGVKKKILKIYIFEKIM